MPLSATSVTAMGGSIDIYRITRQDTPSIEHWPKQSATPPSWLGHHMTDAGLFTLEMGR